MDRGRGFSAALLCRPFQSNASKDVYMFVHMYKCITAVYDMYTCVHKTRYVHIYTCIQIYYTHIHTCADLCIYTYTHTYTYIYNTAEQTHDAYGVPDAGLERKQEVPVPKETNHFINFTRGLKDHMT